MKNIRSIKHILLSKNLIFKLNRKVGKGERNDTMTRKSKSEAFSVIFKQCDEVLKEIETIVYLRSQGKHRARFFIVF